MTTETREFPTTDTARARKSRKRLEAVPMEAISEDATQVRPGEVTATVVTAIFFSIGWIIGASWRAVVFCCLAIRYGYRAGAHVPVEKPKPEPKRRMRPGPGGTIIEE